MERNTVIGIIFLGLLLTVFTIVNQPSEEELKEQQKRGEDYQRYSYIPGEIEYLQTMDD